MTICSAERITKINFEIYAPRDICPAAHFFPFHHFIFMLLFICICNCLQATHFSCRNAFFPKNNVKFLLICRNRKAPRKCGAPVFQNLRKFFKELEVDALLADLDDLDFDDIADGEYILDLLDAMICHLGDVDHAVLTGSELDECAHR